MSLTLYYHPLSSYCHKVLIALYELGIDADKRLINLGDAADRAELAAIWPVLKFPVLRDAARQRDVVESSIIIEYLDHHADGPRHLLPHDWEQALEVRLWDRFFDQHVHTPMQAIVANRISAAGATMERERAGLATAYAILDRHMATRTWAATDEFSMADCAATPALFYAQTLVPVPDAAPHLAAYVERLMERTSVRRVLSEARPYFAMYPFADAIPARYRALD